ncbi:MAG TPA: CHAD domain-containing protein [Hanamia sp.]
METINTSEDLSNYFEKRIENICKILAKPHNEYGNEDYHQLRVEIKKVNALMVLISYCHKDFKKKKYFKPFKSIFKQSGKIRDLQLEESVLEKYSATSIEGFLLRVKNEIKKEEKNFHLLIQNNFKRKINKSYKKIVTYLKEMQPNKVENFIKKETRKLKELILITPLKGHDLHELRKALKIDLYNKKSLNLQDKNGWEEKNDFQELLGNWHDSKMLSNLIEKSIVRKKTDLEELKQLLQIDKEITANTRLLFDKINSKAVDKDLFV